MRDLLTIARRELLEQLRNRWMLVGLLFVAASTPLLLAWMLRMRELLGELSGLGGLALGGVDLPAGAPPELLLERSVRRMMPRNKLARKQLTKLKIYRGPEHPHHAQQPKPLEV